MSVTNRKLRVFLSHGTYNVPAVYYLYDRLKEEDWIVPWLAEADLLPGQDRELELKAMIETTDVALICLSRESLYQEGYFQREIKFLVDIANEKLKGSIFIIPILFDDCVSEMPQSLSQLRPVPFDLGSDNWKQAYTLILKSLAIKFDLVSGKTTESRSSHWISPHQPRAVEDLTTTTFGGFVFAKIPKGKFIMGSRVSNVLAKIDELPQRPYTIPYDYWITRFLISNEQFGEYSVSKRRSDTLPKDWKKKLYQPVVNISWHEAVSYTEWLNKVFMDEIESGLIFRLPTEAEWERASRGDSGGEWPWGNENLDQLLNKERSAFLGPENKKGHAKNMNSDNFAEYFANTSRSNPSGVGNDPEKSSPDMIKMRIAELRSSMELADVGTFSPDTDSPYEVADMMGSIWEWTQSLYQSYPYDLHDGRENMEDIGERVIRGAFMSRSERFSVRSAKRKSATPDKKDTYLGFRIVVAPVVS